MEGYKLVAEYEKSLLDYWEDGHGEMIVLISEMQGFLDCLLKQRLINAEDYMEIIDRLRENLKKTRSK